MRTAIFEGSIDDGVCECSATYERVGVRVDGQGLGDFDQCTSRSEGLHTNFACSPAWLSF